MAPPSLTVAHHSCTAGSSLFATDPQAAHALLQGADRDLQQAAGDSWALLLDAAHGVGLGPTADGQVPEGAAGGRHQRVELRPGLSVCRLVAA